MKVNNISDKYVLTIGIECHVQLKTKTKLFSGTDNDARGAKPNTKVSPICFGLPGTLPVLNEKAVELAIQAGIALNAEIAPVSSFDRKHYFYPDLPKGYQITQLERPIVGKGKINVPLPDGTTFPVRITRAHMEEDAGKLTHPSGTNYSLVDLNRAGTPLLEIVSEADMHSADQAKAYAQELYLLMSFADVTYGDLYHGNMRFDVNISIAKKGSDTLGTRAEIKNLNSFKSVGRAIEYEFNRQAELLERGEATVQETRGWDEVKQKTVSQRSKEDSMDYRYFPDADIPPLQTDPKFIDRLRSSMPLLPPAIRSNLTKHGLRQEDVSTLLSYPVLLHQVLKNAEVATDAELKQLADLLINVVPAEFEAAQQLDVTRAELMGNPENTLKLLRLVNDGVISSSSAKDILRAHWKDLGDPKVVAEQMNLIQMSDNNEIEAIVDEVLKDPNAEKAINDIKAGNDRAIAYLVGQVMKKSKGQANPALTSQLIKQKIEEKSN